MQTDSTPTGGAAPEDRQCQFTKSDGFRCHDWALRGHKHCFRHHQYLNVVPERPIDVPLLETEDDLASLLSQTLRALATGTIPASNGRAILAGCRIMQGIVNHRLARAKFNLKLRRLGTPEMIAEAGNDLFGRGPLTGPEPEPEPESKPRPATRNSDPATRNPIPPTPGPIPVIRTPHPAPHKPSPEPLHPFSTGSRTAFTAPTFDELVAAAYNGPLIKDVTDPISAAPRRTSNL